MESVNRTVPGSYEPSPTYTSPSRTFAAPKRWARDSALVSLAKVDIHSRRRGSSACRSIPATLLLITNANIRSHSWDRRVSFIACLANAQGFSRREREITFERAEFFAREADGCKPLLGRFRSATAFSR